MKRRKCKHCKGLGKEVLFIQGFSISILGISNISTFVNCSKCFGKGYKS